MTKEFYLGADLGNSFCKFVTGPTIREQGKFPSFACPAREEDIESTEGEWLENLIVNIRRIEGKGMVAEETWFVGEKARRARSTKEFGANKAARQNILPLLLTGIAVSARGVFVTPKLGVGLPISHYRRQWKTLKEKLCGTYEVRLPKKQVRVEIKPKNVLVMQECFMIPYDQILDWDGRVINSDLTRAVIGISDPGWKTWNISVMNRLQPENTASTTLNNLGLSDAYVDFLRRANREFDMRPEEIERRFLDLGQEEINRLAQIWENTVRPFPFWSDPRNFDALFLAGGGEAFRNPETGELCFSVYPLKLLKNSQFANARAFYKVARAKLV